MRSVRVRVRVRCLITGVSIAALMHLNAFIYEVYVLVYVSFNISAMKKNGWLLGYLI
jgi:hypothetical protein